MRLLTCIIVMCCGCVQPKAVTVDVAPKLDKMFDKIQADINATNEIVTAIEADVAAIVKRQQQQVNDGGAGNEGGIGLGAYSRYYSGAGLLALMWTLERLGYWLRRWQKSRSK